MDLMKRVESVYNQHRPSLEYFTETDLSGFTFEDYQPLSEANNWLTKSLRYLLNWDLRRTDTANMHLIPDERTVYVHSYQFDTKDWKDEIMQEMEIFYAVVHEMCHMFMYSNSDIPMSPDEDYERFKDTLPLCEGIAHALTFAYIGQRDTDSDDKYVRAVNEIFEESFMPARRDVVESKNFVVDFWHAEDAYKKEGLDGLRKLLNSQFLQFSM